MVYKRNAILYFFSEHKVKENPFMNSPDKKNRELTEIDLFQTKIDYEDN